MSLGLKFLFLNGVYLQDKWMERVQEAVTLALLSPVHHYKNQIVDAFYESFSQGKGRKV